jgi:hypothetical protein
MSAQVAPQEPVLVLCYENQSNSVVSTQLSRYSHNFVTEPLPAGINSQSILQDITADTGLQVSPLPSGYFQGYQHIFKCPYQNKVIDSASGQVKYESCGTRTRILPYCAQHTRMFISNSCAHASLM